MNLKPFLSTVALVAALLGGLLTASPALAASDDECAIWLCLPGGFPSGCGAAKSAMKDRLKDFKPPLPPFQSCVVNSVSIPSSGSTGGETNVETGVNPDDYTYQYGPATWIREHQVCANWVESGPPRARSRRCVDYDTIPGKYVHRRCWVDRDGNETPEYCSGNFRFVQVFINGVQTGETFYWN